MEAELEKFRRRKIAEERSVRIKEYIQNVYNKWTLKLTNALLPEPRQEQGDKSSSNEDEDDAEEGKDDNVKIKTRTDKKLLLKKSKRKVKREILNSTSSVQSEDTEIGDDEDNDCDSEDENDDDSISKPIKWASVCLKVTKFLMWVLTWIGFFKIGFGAVFFCLSALLFIWFSTDNRRRKRKQGEKSAYSVFNENCEAIDGSLDAKQLEKQLVFGPLGHFGG